MATLTQRLSLALARLEYVEAYVADTAQTMGVAGQIVLPAFTPPDLASEDQPEAISAAPAGRDPQEVLISGPPSAPLPGGSGPRDALADGGAA